MILSIADKRPQIDPNCFVAPTAQILGDVEIKKQSGVWYGAVIRGDSQRITIGERSNIQDLCVLHVDAAHGLTIGDEVTVGHRAIVHGATIGNRVLVGMGAIIMNGVVVGDDCIIGAGALVTEGAQIPPRSLVLGMPAKVTRALTDEDVAQIHHSSQHYAETAARYRAHGLSSV